MTVLRASSSPWRATASPYVAPIGLVALLAAELLYLTVRFDTEPLDASASIWMRIIGWSPDILRLFVSITFATFVFAGTRLVEAVRSQTRGSGSSSRLAPFLVHAGALLLFVRVSAMVMALDPLVGAHPALFAWLWASAAGLVVASWGLTLLPLDGWRYVVRDQSIAMLCGAMAGLLLWLAGFATEALWIPLARFTFAIVSWVLNGLYADAISDPGQLMAGTGRFRVFISPECSGYEGIGLILAFLTLYLWLCRRELRWPAAFWLLPLGALAVWVLNLARIVALVAIGTAGWKAMAKGGFHSQAGWLAFNAVALGFVLVVHHGRYFRRDAEARPLRPLEPEATTAYLAPFLAILGTALLTGLFAGSVDWLYPLRVCATLAVLWVFRSTYAQWRWSISWPGIGLGAATFGLWLVLAPEAAAQPAWPAALQSVPLPWAATWLAFRVAGYVLTVPIAEELAFRGYLTRRLIRSDFDALPIGTFTWWSFIGSSLLFGAFHGGFWMGGIAAGLAYALALYRRGAFGDAVQAHVTTNGLIVVYGWMTGDWSVWG